MYLKRLIILINSVCIYFPNTDTQVWIWQGEIFDLEVWGSSLDMSELHCPCTFSEDHFLHITIAVKVKSHLLSLQP